MTPKELIQSMFDELAKGNSRRFVELMADDITWTVMGRTRWSGTYHGKTKVLNDLLGVLRARLDGPYRATADRILAEGPYVVVQARGDSKTKAGMPYNNEYCFIYRVEGGKIREVVEYLDTELVTAALTAEA
ncbi:MAG TPA: nuclear transport factor 2 family protein [Thermoanaerobaculia bacterium]|nr:nuclear transport factor 2 family protein [Thermoanaerobaculia bacterium]